MSAKRISQILPGTVHDKTMKDPFAKTGIRQTDYYCEKYRYNWIHGFLTILVSRMDFFVHPERAKGFSIRENPRFTLNLGELLRPLQAELCF